jgi:predicted dehydrogenase
MTVVGDKKMVVYDDVSENRLMIFDKGVAWVEDGANYGSHRLMTFSGDIYIPKLSATEPLQAEIQHFLDCIRTGASPLSDGVDGREVVRVLEGVAESLAHDGAKINL